MNETLIAMVIQYLAVPIVSAIIRAHSNATGGQMPSDAQIIAALGSDTSAYANMGIAFLQSKGVAFVSTPVTVSLSAVSPQPSVASTPIPHP